jgi:thiamine-monophosphate kinase
VPHEFDYIAWIRDRITRSPRVPLGPGDDTALVTFPAPGECLVTVDMLMEGVDFTFPPATPRQAGRKALAVNLSDLAAMAGRPVAWLASVALPRSHGLSLGRELFEGMHELARAFDVPLAGGDTNTWNGPLVISITALGEPTGRGPVLRGGALPGDWIMVTGELGGSLAGRHLDFTPRVHEAMALHGAATLHAMIDLSDGLASDLRHILEESHVGAILDEAAIPVSASALAARDGRTSLEHALGDGEDFELLFTVSPEEGRALLARRPCDVRLTHVGEIISGGDCLLKTTQGAVVPLPEIGWKHDFETRSAS